MAQGVSVRRVRRVGVSVRTDTPCPVSLGATHLHLTYSQGSGWCDWPIFGWCRAGHWMERNYWLLAFFCVTGGNGCAGGLTDCCARAGNLSVPNVALTLAIDCPARAGNLSVPSVALDRDPYPTLDTILWRENVARRIAYTEPLLAFRPSAWYHVPTPGGPWQLRAIGARNATLIRRNVAPSQSYMLYRCDAAVLRLYCTTPHCPPRILLSSQKTSLECNVNARRLAALPHAGGRLKRVPGRTALMLSTKFAGFQHSIINGLPSAALALRLVAVRLRRVGRQAGINRSLPPQATIDVSLACADLTCDALRAALRYAGRGDELRRVWAVKSHTLYLFDTLYLAVQQAVPGMTQFAMTSRSVGPRARAKQSQVRNRCVASWVIRPPWRPLHCAKARGLCGGQRCGGGQGNGRRSIQCGSRRAYTCCGNACGFDAWCFRPHGVRLYAPPKVDYH